MNQKLLIMIKDIPWDAEDEVEKSIKKNLIQQEAIVKGKYPSNYIMYDWKM